MTPICLRFATRFAVLLLAGLLFVAWPLTAQAAMIPVNTTDIGIADDSLCSLTEAIIAANMNSVGAENDCVAGDDSPVDTIVLATNATYITSGNYASYSGFTAYPAITSTIVISGNGSTLVRTASEASNDLARFFYVEAATGDFTLDNLTLTNGNMTGQGGAVYVEGVLTVVNSTLLSNTSSFKGGALVGGVNSTTALINSILQDNASDFGGALYGELATVTVTNSEFISNTADISGGGMHLDSASNATVTNSRFEVNEAESGGGFYNSDISTLTLMGSTLRDNRADTGAAIANGFGATVTVTNTQFLTNVATLYGGGLFNSNQALLFLDDSRVQDNSATTGAGIYNTTGSTATINSTIIVGNIATSNGAGIVNEGGSLIEITSSDVLSNTALADGGGGLMNTSSSTARVTETDFIGNQADDDGGAIYHTGTEVVVRDSRLLNNQAGEGGGAAASETVGLTLEDSCIVGNSDVAVVANGGSTIETNGNWWGAPDGPSGAQLGTGDSVNEDVFVNFYFVTPILGCDSRNAQVELAVIATPTGNVLPLQPLTYTVVVTNVGTEDVYNLTVVDPLPVDYQNLSSFTTGPTINQNGNRFVIPSLAPAEVATIVFVGNPQLAIANDLTLTNTATISHALAGSLVASVANDVIVPKFSWSGGTYFGEEGNAGSTMQVELQLIPPTPYVSASVRTAITDYNGTNFNVVTFPPNTVNQQILLDAGRDGRIGQHLIALGLDQVSFAALGNPSSARAFLDDTDSLGLEISQEVSSLTAFLNETITYTYQARNTGTIDLDLEGYDSFDGALVEFFQTLEAQEIFTVTRAVNLSDEEYEVGEVVNTLVVTGTDPSLTPLGRSETVTVSIGITGETGLELTIIPSTDEVRLGEVVTYTYSIANTGTLALENLELEDRRFGVSFSLGSLNPGATARPTYTRTVRREDLHGPLVNDALLTAVNPLAETVTITGTASVDIVPYDTSLPFLERQ